MDSFKLYLPSNASTQHFPQNSSSAFKTRLNNPIHLTGNWEVAVESLFYKTKVIKNEESEIKVELETQHRHLVNAIYDYEFKMSKIWTYKTFGLRSLSLHPPPTYKQSIEKLNEVNREILFGLKDIFKFYFTNDAVTFKAETDAFSIALTAKMAKHCGFGSRTILTGSKPIIANKADPQELLLTDYDVSIFEQNVIKRKERIYIKSFGQGTLKPKQLIRRWKKKVAAKYDINLSFENGKVVIQNENENIALSFSKQLDICIGFHHPIFTKGTFVSPLTYLQDLKSSVTEFQWYVDIYGDELSISKAKYLSSAEFSYKFIPRSFPSIGLLYTHLNRELLTLSRKKIKEHFNSHEHSIKFSIDKDNNSKLEVGESVTIELDETLSYLLGFPKKSFVSGETIYSKMSAVAIDEREQFLCLHANVIQPISYGDEKRYILQQFLHNKTDSNGIIVKRFEPLSFLPILSNFIDQVEIKITNIHDKVINFLDSKTIVLLHFRKIQ